MVFARSNGCRIHYKDSGGDLPPLLLVRGLTRSGRYWDDIESGLNEHFRTLIVDNRGTGLSDKPKRGYSTKLMAMDLLSVLDHSGISKASLFGISLGG